jgi:glycosyltransferase involved in cell wall biosynthesis
VRIAFVVDWFLKYTAELAPALKKSGAEVLIVVRSHAKEFGNDSAEKAALQEELRGQGINILTLRGRLTQPSAYPDAFRVRRALLEWRPTLLHIQSNYDLRLLYVAHGFPRVLTIHDPVSHPGAENKSLFRRAIARTWMRGASAIIVHGAELVGELGPACATTPIVVIPHGARVASEALPPPDAPIVLLFGRLEPYKGAHVLMEAMRLLWERIPDARLLVVGSGPEAETFAGEPRVWLREGYLPEAGIEEMLSRARVAVLPYTQASASGVGALTVARGIPTVVTRVGALPDLVHDERFAVAPRDPVALAAALELALGGDSGLRAAVLEHARQRSSYEVVAERHLATYRGVLERDVTAHTPRPPAAE